jgi:WD40 repeat protein
LSPQKLKALVPNLLTWREQHNLYPSGTGFANCLVKQLQEPLPAEDIERSDWTTLWKLSETHSAQGSPKFKGGDLRVRVAADPGSVTPDDFRLRPDSPGYRKGKDGRDLGADVDLVGPGEAYDRWKQTPEYQRWLKDTGPDSGSATTPLDFPVGEVRKNFWPGRYAYFARFSPDGKYYAATGGEGATAGNLAGSTLRVWETASGKLAMEVTGIEFLLFTPDGKQLITSGPDKMIHTWDLATKKEVARFGQHPDWIRVSSLSPDGKQLLTGCNDGIVRLWDVAKAKEIARLESDNKLGVPHFCPGGKQAITCDDHGILRLWDLTERKEVRRWQQPDILTGHLAFLPGGQRFVASGLETVYFFDLAVEKETKSLRLAGKLAGIAFSPDGSRLFYTVKFDPTMRLVELPGGKELATFETVNLVDDNPVGINFSPDGRFAVAASCCGVVHLWRLPDPPAAGKK